MTAAKLTKTGIAYLQYLNGTGPRPRCSYGTIAANLRRAGMIESVLIPGQEFARMDVLTDAGKAAIA